MKALMRILIVAMLAMSLTACSSTQETDAPAEEPQATAETTEAEATEAEAEATEEEKEATEEKAEPTAEAAEETGPLMVSTLDAEKNAIEIEVPRDPQRIAVVDYVAVDMLKTWGLEDRIVGAVKGSAPSYLKDVVDNEDVADLGSFFEIDMEALKSAEPDIIFNTSRNTDKYNELSEIAPTVNNAVNNKVGFVETFTANMERNGKIFGKEKEAEAAIKDMNDRIAAMKEVGDGKTALLLIVTGGSVNTLGNESRGSMVFRYLGFENLAGEINDRHGNQVSFEFLVEKDPDYLFVLDRDTAIGKEAETAQKILDNEIVYQTKAHKEGNIVYLTPDVWYLAEGGIKALDIMLTDLEKGLGVK